MVHRTVLGNHLAPMPTGKLCQLQVLAVFCLDKASTGKGGLVRVRLATIHRTIHDKCLFSAYWLSLPIGRDE